MEKIKSSKVEVRKPEEMSIIRDNNTLRIYNGSVSIDRYLEPTKNYELNWDAGGCKLDIVEGFAFPEKLYDVEEKFRKQILRTFRAQNRNVGVLYEGYKGQGKTINAKLLCREANLPVILINNRIPQQVDFVQFINSLKTDLIVYIDEFEKLFPQTYTSNQQDGFHSQESFLGFMDGAIGGKYKRLFVLTTNDNVNDKLINRPSRVRYYRRYSQMDPKVYDMIIEDKLVNKQHEKDLRENLTTFDCTVDLLTTVIEEINIHDMSYSSFKDVFNHKPNVYRYERYSQDKMGRWTLKDRFETSRKIERTDTTIAGNYNARVIDIKDDCIIYKVDEWKVKNEGTEEETEEMEEVIYKLVEINTGLYRGAASAY